MERKMKTLTVFTPTFNRAYTLELAYKSLLSQLNKDFLWLIVDDGSSDGTGDLVNAWIDEGKIPIEYIRQKNLGMLGAHNTALSTYRTELFVCLDSDDHFPEDAVAKIIDKWRDCRAIDACGGIVGLDVSPEGIVVGDAFPAKLDFVKYNDMRFRYKILGDKKYVMSRRALDYAGLYPTVSGEKYPASSYLYRVISNEFTFAVINEPLCIVEYLPDGNTKNKLKQYKNDPNAFMEYRLFCMDNPYNLREKFWAAAHFVSSAIFAGKLRLIILNRHFPFTIATTPLGIAIWIYVTAKLNSGRYPPQATLSKKAVTAP